MSSFLERMSWAIAQPDDDRGFEHERAIARAYYLDDHELDGEDWDSGQGMGADQSLLAAAAAVDAAAVGSSYFGSPRPERQFGPSSPEFSAHMDPGDDGSHAHHMPARDDDEFGSLEGSVQYDDDVFLDSLPIRVKRRHAPLHSDRGWASSSRGELSIAEHSAHSDDGDSLESGKMEKEDASAAASKPRGMNALQLAAILYFLTCGGPYGIENCVQAAGVLYSLIGFVAIPLLWSLPQALMAAELSLMIPENGGPIVWVRRAFGDMVGFVNSYNSILNQFISNSLYVVLFVDYFPWDLPWWGALLMKVVFVVVVAIINMIGVEWLSRISWLLLILVLTPFVLMIVMVFVRRDFDAAVLDDHPALGKVQWSLFLSTIIWCYGGYDSVGSVAGEVGNSRSTFLLGLGLALPANIGNYLIPVAFGYMVSPHAGAWESGHFSDIAYKLGGWLGVMTVVASAISNFGQYNSAAATMSRLLWAMGRGRGKPLPRFVSWSYNTPNAARPIMAIIIASTATLAISLVGNFDVLVQVNVVIRVMVLMLEFLALIVLRFREPFMRRPFVVPLGAIGPWLLITPPLLIAFFILYFGSWRYLAGAILLDIALVGLYALKLTVKTFWILWRDQRDIGLAHSAARRKGTRLPSNSLYDPTHFQITS